MSSLLPARSPDHTNASPLRRGGNGVFRSGVRRFLNHGGSCPLTVIARSWKWWDDTQGCHGDLDGNGADVVWRNTTTGDVVASLMNGLTMGVSEIITGIVPLEWKTQH